MACVRLALLLAAGVSVGAASDSLRGRPVHTLTAISAGTDRASALQGAHLAAAPPCTCQSGSGAWKKATRTVPKCIFIDLGANSGNTYDVFLAGGFVNRSKCPNGEYEAWLVEANPLFDDNLKGLQEKHAGQVHAMSSTAAYMCDAQTTFYLDTETQLTNHTSSRAAGSTMADNKETIIRSGKKKVTVPTVNVARLIYENAIPEDNVLLKMDVEGAEWDIVPCLASSTAVPLVDHFFVETHNQSWSLTGTPRTVYEASLASMKKQGVDIPEYTSITLAQLASVAPHSHGFVH